MLLIESHLLGIWDVRQVVEVDHHVLLRRRRRICRLGCADCVCRCSLLLLWDCHRCCVSRLPPPQLPQRLAGCRGCKRPSLCRGELRAIRKGTAHASGSELLLGHRR